LKLILTFLVNVYKYLKYLFENKSPCHNWFEVIWCRLKGHPKGVIWYNVGRIEPDMTCRGCGDDLG
jgi:hypothetical protein